VNPQSDELAMRVVRILARYAESPNVGDALDPTVPVFGPAGIITDSLAVLDALCEIEADLDVSIPDEDLTEELFASVDHLVTYLRSRVVVQERA
jgi:hypothetical protein